jgi:UDP-glucose 4-epimerase
MYMRVFYGVYGLPTVSLRYFNIFGPRQDPTSQYSAVLAKFITLMLRGERPTVYGDGEQSRDFNYIDNAVQANLLATTAPENDAAGQVFNIATGHRFDLKQTFALLKPLTGYTGELEYAAERKGDIKHSLADITRAQEKLGYQPKVNFEEGLRRTVEWYRASEEAQKKELAASR